MNNSMLAFLGVPEIIVIFLVLLVMAGMAAAAALLVVWLLRRNEGTPAASPTSPPRFDPPHATGKAGRFPFADLRAGGVRIRWGNYLAGMAAVVLGGALLNGSLLAVGVWSGMDTVLFGLLVAVVAFHLFVIRDFHRAGHAAVSAPAPSGVPPTQSPAPAATAPPVCPRCSASLPANSPQGLCPRCVMGVGLATHTEAPGETGPHGTKVLKPAPTPEEIARHFPQLEIMECLGRGGMGVVYKARQPKLNRLVALKILAPEKGADPKFAERFQREALALAKLNHPNIVTVHDFGEAEGMFFLLMEFVDGLSLRQTMREGLMKPEAALAIVPKICEALQFAHEQGVVHRDIKPENVLLDSQGRVKIADFGIAKMVADAGEFPFVVPPSGGPDRLKPELQTLTQDQVLGTPNYMAPEQVEKPQTVDHRADIYSLGVVFYEMLTGELPLGKFQPPSKKVQVDVRLDEVVLHALEKEPERRYQHANEVKSDVETIATGEAKSEVRSPKSELAHSDLPHLSRLAICGAVWAAFSLLGLLSYFLLSIPTTAGAAPVRWTLLLGFPLGLLGLTAPFGTTILGWIAVSQIRHSQGRLYGLGLAAFDALLFPLLALDALIMVLFKYLGAFIVHDFGLPHTVQLRTLFVLMVVCIVVLDWLIVRAVWRAAQTPLDGRNPETPRAPDRSSRVVRAGVLAVAIAALGVVVAAAFFSGRNETPAMLAKSPQKLKSLPTTTVIQAGLAEPGLPWAWNELKRRSEAGQLNAGEADTIVAELAAWMRREHPQGYDEPLHWLGGLLDELGRRRLVTDEKVLAFLEAFYGEPRCEKPLRVRENEPQPALSVTCRWRSSFTQELFGLKLLNEIRSITIDGKEAKWRDVHPNCEQYEFYGNLELPALASGKYTVRFEIESALIAKGDVVGLAPDTLAEDWPPAKRRWTRVCQSELVVYPVNTEIVSLTEDPALDPVTSGALSVKQVFIRSDSSRATAAVAVVVLEKDNSGQKLLVPISFDVSLRLSGEAYPCGRFWSAAKGTRGGFTPNSGSRSELSTGIKPLSPEVLEAEVVLTPNPKAIEQEGSIDEIWGREIVFSHVRLVRQDLRGADKPSFGAAIEAMLPFGAPCENHYLQFRSGRVFTIGRGPATTKAEYDEDWKRAKAAGGVDVSAGGSKEGIQFVGEGCIFTGERKPTWEATTAEEVLQQLEHASWVYGVIEPKSRDFPITYLFKTARGESGLVQLLDVVEDERGYHEAGQKAYGVKLRYKLVKSDSVNLEKATPQAAHGLGVASGSSNVSKVVSNRDPYKKQRLLAETMKNLKLDRAYSPGERLEMVLATNEAAHLKFADNAAGVSEFMFRYVPDGLDVFYACEGEDHDWTVLTAKRTTDSRNISKAGAQVWVKCATEWRLEEGKAHVTFLAKLLSEDEVRQIKARNKDELARRNQQRLASLRRVLEWEDDQTAAPIRMFIPSREDSNLTALRTQYELEKVVAGSAADYEQLQRLVKWAHDRWEHTGDNTPSKSDPLTILDEAAQGRRFRCVEYATVVAGCAQVLGMPARVLALKREDVETAQSGAGHVVAEVWLPSRKKWVFADGQWDAIPEKDGVPLNAVEFQDAFAHHAPGLTIRSSSKTDTDSYLRWVVPYLYYFDFNLSQNLFATGGDRAAQPQSEPVRGCVMLVPKGAKNPVVFQRTSPIKNCTYISNPQAFYAAPTDPSP